MLSNDTVLLKIIMTDIVIMSCGRYKTMTSLSIFPSAKLYVPENEKQQYLKRFPEADLFTVMPKLGFGKTINFIMDYYKKLKKDCFIIDDDLTSIYISVGNAYSAQILEYEHFLDILEETTELCKQCGFGQFSFSNWISFTGQFENYHVPFSIGGRQQRNLGIISGCGIAFDETLSSALDLDHVCKSILAQGGIFCDHRIRFGSTHSSSRSIGGLTDSNDHRIESYLEIKKRWGRHVRIVKESNSEANTLPIVSIRR